MTLCVFCGNTTQEPIDVIWGCMGCAAAAWLARETVVYFDGRQYFNVPSGVLFIPEGEEPL